MRPTITNGVLWVSEHVNIAKIMYYLLVNETITTPTNFSVNEDFVAVFLTRLTNMD